MKLEQKLSGLWHNQYGSEMRLEVSPEGRISGKFRTEIGRQEVKALWADTWFDVVGFAKGELFGIVINYESTGTIAIASGRFVAEQESKTGKCQLVALGYTTFPFSEEDRWRQTAVTSTIYDPGPA